MNALKAAILAHEQDFVSALNADFAHRSREETLMFDVGSTVGTINYLLRHLSRWMRPEPCDVALLPAEHEPRRLPAARGGRRRLALELPR